MAADHDVFERNLEVLRADLLRRIRLDDDEGFSWEDTPFVACDEPCFALREPLTVQELRAALVHWRDHSFTRGCSHGK